MCIFKLVTIVSAVMLLFRSQWVSKERFLFPQECFRKPVVNIPFPRSQTESVFKAKIFQPAALQDGELIRFLLSFFVSQLSFRLSFSTRTSSEPSLFTQTVIWREKKPPNDVDNQNAWQREADSQRDLCRREAHSAERSLWYRASSAARRCEKRVSAVLMSHGLT